MTRAPGGAELLMVPLLPMLMLQGDAADPSTTTGAPGGLASCAAVVGQPVVQRQVPPLAVFVGQLAAAACCSSACSCVEVSVVGELPLLVCTFWGGWI